MTDMDLSTLQRFRADIEAQGEGVYEVPQTLPTARLREGTVLSFDQSLGATGYVVIEKGPALLSCYRAETIKAPAGLNLRSNLDMLAAGEHLYDVAFVIIRDTLAKHADLKVVHETPPNAGKVKGSGTSSLVSAMAIRAACKAHGVTVQVIGRQTWAKFMCGNGNADKKVAHAHLAEFVIGGNYPTNEGQRDALCLGLTALRGD